MKFLQAIFMALLVALVDCLSGCVAKTSYEQKSTSLEKIKLEFHQLVETRIPISEKSEVNADIFRPIKKFEPETVVIMAPGAGNVSRKGEVSNDGVNNYSEALPLNHLWASALSEKGIFVLSYDKRTCTKSINKLCITNPQNDIEALGITALASDLDSVVDFVRKKFRARVVLMSTSQGAQTITLSKSARDVHAIILLSPIVYDLEMMWTKGLQEASLHAPPNQKMRLLNQKESMASFFKSLKAGQFPETSNIRGASVKFWRTWIDESKNTVTTLKKNNLPTLLLFSAQDSFSSPAILVNIGKQLNKSKRIKIKNISEVDRNFIYKNGVSKVALDEVVSFITNLPPKT